MKLKENLRSVRFVLTLWYSVVLLAALAVFGASMYFYLEYLVDQTLKDSLVAEVDWIARLVDVERQRFTGPEALQKLSEDLEERIDEHFMMNPRNYIVLLTSLERNIVYESGSRGEKTLYDGEVPPKGTLLKSIEDPDDGSLQVAARRGDPFIIQVAYPERAVRTVLNHVLSILGILIPVVLLFSFAGGWILAGAVLRPIRQISDMANRITAQNLNERIPARNVADELGKLINTINRMIERLQSSFIQIRQFSMNVAHELKTPLTILKGESELALSRPPTPEETQQLITSYLEETARLSRIVDDLLTLAKADAGQITIHHEPVQIHKLMEELFEEATILTSDRQIDVKLKENEPMTIAGDPVRLRQLFRNLIMNAVQYTDAGGTISLSSQLKNGELNVTIEDTGIGIPAGDLDRIFEPFYRVETPRPRSRGGSGLGLSIAKWVTSSHGGRISVRSSLGQGSSFTVHLPIANPNPSVR